MSKKTSFKEKKNELKKLAKNNQYLIKPFLFFLGIYLVGISAILLSGAHYADDVARTNYGYPGWSAFSRYISTASSLILHADKFLTNIAPLPQLIAIVLLSIASTILVCLVSGREVFKEKWTKWFWRIIATIPFGLCPYMLECLSYQYDAPYMMLSILASITPLVFRKNSKPIYVSAIFIGILIACMTYQASIGIFAVLVVFLSIKDWSEDKSQKAIDTIKYILWSAGSFLVSLLFFQKLLMRPRELYYVSNNIPSIDNFLPEFIKHLQQYYELVIKDFKVFWLLFVALILIVFIIIFAIKSKRNRIIAMIIALLGIVAMGIVAYAPYSALSTPIYSTRAMYPIGSVLATLGIYIVSKKGWKRIVVIPVVALSWCFFVFAFTYGNALKEQTKFRDMQEDMAIKDLNEILVDMDDSRKLIGFSGQIDYAPAIKHMPEDTFWLVHRLLKPTFGRNVPWMAYRLTECSGFDNLIIDQNNELSEKDLPVLKDTKLYTIKGDNNGIIVDFKGERLNTDF